MYQLCEIVNKDSFYGESGVRATYGCRAIPPRPKGRGFPRKTMTPRLPPRESLTVEFKSDLKKLPDRELIEALICLANAEGGAA